MFKVLSTKWGRYVVISTSATLLAYQTFSFCKMNQPREPFEMPFLPKTTVLERNEAEQDINVCFDAEASIKNMRVMKSLCFLSGIFEIVAASAFFFDRNAIGCVLGFVFGGIGILTLRTSLKTRGDDEELLKIVEEQKLLIFSNLLQK